MLSGTHLPIHVQGPIHRPLIIAEPESSTANLSTVLPGQHVTLNPIATARLPVGVSMGTAEIIKGDQQLLVQKEELTVLPVTQLREAVIPEVVVIIQLPAAVPLVEAAVVHSPAVEAAPIPAVAVAPLAEVAAEAVAGAKT
jgi:hypothetical protein